MELERNMRLIYNCSQWTQGDTSAEKIFENEAEPNEEEDEDFEIRRLRSELWMISKLKKDWIKTESKLGTNKL